MPQPSTAELQQLARDTFGRELSAAQAEAYRSRLPFMAQAIHTLQAWESRLRDSEPAAIHRTPLPTGDAYGTV
ncbi:MAG TPA: hypothetical protein VIH59_12770 [Candidatus Tectomicrobia bacterium]